MPTRRTTWTALVPIVLPLLRDEVATETVLETVNSISALGKHFSFQSGAPVEIGALDPKTQTKIEETFLPRKHVRHRIVIGFVFQPIIDEDRYSTYSDGRQIDKKTRRELAEMDLENDVRHEVTRLVLAANVAMPGSISTDQGVLLCGKQRRASIPAAKSSLNWLVTEAAKNSLLPKILSLDVSQVLRWFNSLADTDIAFGKSPIGRGLAAFSHLFRDDLGQGNPMDEIWAIIGLEALASSQGSQRVLADRLEILLKKNIRNLIQQLYAERSALIHGGRDIPFNFCEFNGTPEYSDYHKKMRVFGHVGIPLLVSALQHIAADRRKALEFKQVLSS